MELAPQVATLKERLAEVAAALHKAEPSPRTREIRTRVSTYERVVGGWSFRPPTAAQCAAMMECVMEIHAMVVARSSMRPNASMTRSTRPPPGRASRARTTRPPPGPSRK